MNSDLTSRLHVPGPSSRYILPQFEERTSYGMKRLDPYTKLFEDRIIFLGVQVDDASADDVIAQLIVLESQDPDRDILMYINSPGGSFTAMTAIYDTMQYIRPKVATTCIGQAASMGSFLLAAGEPGMRTALANARIIEGVREIRRIGTMTGIEVEPVRERTGFEICRLARRRGVAIRPLGDVVVLMPPLAIGDDDLELLAGTALECIAEVVG